MRVRGTGILVLTACLLLGVPAGLARAGGDEAFRTQLDELAKSQGLPGYAAVLIRSGKIVWATASGYADIEAKIPATPDTPYRLASLSKPIAATILMELVESGDVGLDAPMNQYDMHAWFEPGGGSWAHYPSRYDDGAIKVRHVLTHTSESAPPGEAYKYSGNIFGDLTWVVESATHQSYPDVVIKRIIDPLGMTNSSPGQLVPSRQDVVKRLAKPYKIEDGNAVLATYPGFGLDPDVDVTPWNLKPAYRLPRESQEARRKLLGDAFTPLYSSQSAAGMIASVNDLARFDIAFDGERLVSAKTRKEMFTPSHTSSGERLPYGLGWFVEDVDGKQVVWHFGWFPPVISALYVKLPGQHLTFIMLTNCDKLSANYSWTAEGVRASPVTRLFLDTFLN